MKRTGYLKNRTVRGYFRYKKLPPDSVRGIVPTIDRRNKMVDSNTISEGTTWWRRGEIFLHLNDCFNVLPHIKEHSVDMVLSDLPYGTTACQWDSVLPLPELWKEYTRILKPNGVVVQV